jgi:DNA-binding response OmpR family regulator
MLAENSATAAVQSLQRADDFVRLPVAPAEVAARIRSILRRISNFGYASSPVVAIDERLQLDYRHRAIIVAGEQIGLTPTECSLLSVLMLHRGRVVDSRTLILRTWTRTDIYEDTLRVHIHRLRQKLEPDPRKPAYLLTERAVGYRFRG